MKKCYDAYGRVIPCNPFGNARDLVTLNSPKSDNTNVAVNTRIGTYNTRQTDYNALKTDEELNRNAAYKKKQNIIRKQTIKDNVARSNNSVGVKQQIQNTAIGDKMRWFPDADENTFGQMFDEKINPFVAVGNMADGLSTVFDPNATMGEKALSVAMPIVLGKFAGGKGVSPLQKANNIFNPLSRFNLEFAAMNETGLPELLDKPINYVVNLGAEEEKTPYLGTNNIKQLGGNINNMNNFFNQKRQLRSFQKGGPKPVLGADDTIEDYQARMAQWEQDNAAPAPAPTPAPYEQLPASANNIMPVDPVTLNSPQANAAQGYQGNSIVDYLKSIGQDASKANRRKLAAASGDSNYNMSASDNLALLNSLRNGTAGIAPVPVVSNGQVVSSPAPTVRRASAPQAGQATPSSQNPVVSPNGTFVVPRLLKSPSQQQQQSFFNNTPALGDATQTQSPAKTPVASARRTSAPVAPAPRQTSGNNVATGVATAAGVGAAGYGAYKYATSPNGYNQFTNLMNNGVQFSGTNKGKLTKANNALKNNATTSIKKSVESFEKLPQRQKTILNNLDIAEIPGTNTKASIEALRVNQIKQNLAMNEGEYAQNNKNPINKQQLAIQKNLAKAEAEYQRTPNATNKRLLEINKRQMAEVARAAEEAAIINSNKASFKKKIRAKFKL